MDTNWLAESQDKNDADNISITCVILYFPKYKFYFISRNYFIVFLSQLFHYNIYIYSKMLILRCFSLSIFWFTPFLLQF